MCGICGVVSTHPGSIPIAHVLERMRDTLTHRGPDGAGMHLGEGVGLGHRRLSIVDVEHGQQPMFSSDGRYVITYNGELFNHPALKPELEAAGVHYHTRSDTETALHLYVLHGPKAVLRMRGMFAIALSLLSMGGRLESLIPAYAAARRIRGVDDERIAAL